MKDIIVFGCGGLGREILFQIKEQNKIRKEYNILGFADDNESMWGKTLSGYPVFGGSDFLLSYEKNLCVVIAIGKPHIRKLIYDKISKNSNIEFPSIIAPNVVLTESSKIGKGCIVGFFTYLSVDTEIGDFVLVSNGCNVGHDAVIDSFTTLYPGVHVSGNVHVEKECEIGVGSNIIQGLKIGQRTIIGAGASVIRDIEGECTAVGVPAKIIKRNERI